jgi:hypothetical protein
VVHQVGEKSDADKFYFSGSLPLQERGEIREIRARRNFWMRLCRQQARQTPAQEFAVHRASMARLRWG